MGHTRHRTTGARSPGRFRRAPCYRCPGSCCLLRGRGQGGNPAVGRIHHDRRSPRRYDFGATVEPELVISPSHVGDGIGASAIPIVRRHDLLLILGGFLFGEIFFAGELARPFKRSNRGVRPNSLEVRLAVRRPRHGPFFGDIARDWALAGTAKIRATRTNARAAVGVEDRCFIPIPRVIGDHHSYSITRGSAEQGASGGWVPPALR